jgi:hypothetical protein
MSKKKLSTLAALKHSAVFKQLLHDLYLESPSRCHELVDALRKEEVQ